MHMSQLTRGIQSIPQVCRLFYKFGRQHNAALRQWYSFGVAVAAMLGMSVIFMLLQDVWLAIAWIKEVCLQYYFCIECPSLAAMRKQLTFLIIFLCPETIQRAYAKSMLLVWAGFLLMMVVVHIVQSQ